MLRQTTERVISTDGDHLQPGDPFAQHDQAENGADGQHAAGLKRRGDGHSHDAHRPHEENAAQLRDQSDGQ